MFSNLMWMHIKLIRGNPQRLNEKAWLQKGWQVLRPGRRLYKDTCTLFLGKQRLPWQKQHHPHPRREWGHSALSSGHGWGKNVSQNLGLEPALITSHGSAAWIHEALEAPGRSHVREDCGLQAPGSQCRSTLAWITPVKFQNHGLKKKSQKCKTPGETKDN